MTEEEYSMDLYLVVQESEAAMDKGNIYVSALIKPQQESKSPFHLHKMGTIKPKASIILSAKQLLSYLPLVCFFLDCSSQQTVRISLADRFSNANFHAKSIELTLS